MHTYEDTDDAIHIPANDFMLFLWSTGGGNVPSKTAKCQKRHRRLLASKHGCKKGFNIFKIIGFADVSWEKKTAYLLELKDSHSAFWWVKLNVNRNFVYKKTPQGTFKYSYHSFIIHPVIQSFTEGPSIITLSQLKSAETFYIRRIINGYKTFYVSCHVEYLL